MSRETETDSEDEAHKARSDVTTKGTLEVSKPSMRSTGRFKEAVA